MSANSADEWLATLQTRVTVKPLDGIDFTRAVQLLNKTNQMNLSTRRLSAAELTAWLNATPQRRFWAFRVADKFGDSGLVGLLSTESNGDQARIVDFVLSCRVIGRKVEETMLHVAAEWARGTRSGELCAEYRATAKNSPCVEFFRRSGFHEQPNETFVWSLEREYPLPNVLALDRQDKTETRKEAVS